MILKVSESNFSGLFTLYTFIKKEKVFSKTLISLGSIVQLILPFIGLNSLIGASVSRENKTPSSPSDIIGI